MKLIRLSIVLALLLIGGLPAAAQGCGQSNPNCIVPTAPVGTSDNRAASTQFVQQNLTSVRSFGAVGDGSTDDTAAIQACVTAAQAGSGTGTGACFFPHTQSPSTPNGCYKTTSSIFATAGTPLTIWGEGRSASLFCPVFASGQAVFNFALLSPNSQVLDIRGLGFLAPTGAGAATTPALHFINNNGVHLEDLKIDGYFFGADFTTSFAPNIVEVEIINSKSDALLFNDNSCNQAVIKGGSYRANGITNSATALVMGIGCIGFDIQTDLEGNFNDIAFNNSHSGFIHGSYLDTVTNTHFVFSGTNSALNFTSNWLGTSSALILGASLANSVFAENTQSGFNIAVGTSTGVCQTNFFANNGTETNTLPKCFDSTAWTAFTMNPVCGTASITPNAARSKTIGKLTSVLMEFTITAIGTCGSSLTITLPNTANSNTIINGRELVSETMVACRTTTAPTATLSCLKNGFGAYLVNDVVLVEGIYENQ